MAAVTIYDVARRAGVSIATVSRVLNAPDRVAEETRTQVLTAIDELGFVPKFEARTRARKQIGRIGVLTPHFTADSFVDRLRGVSAALAGLPYELVVYDVTTPAQRDGYLTSLAITHQVDGLIVIGLPFDATMASRLRKHRMAVVQIGTLAQPFSHVFDRIVTDDEAAGRIAAGYLLSRGHRRVGFVGTGVQPDVAPDFGTTNLDGFRQALALAGVPLPNAYVSLAAFGLEQARQQAYRLLDLPLPPTAIYAASDTQAIGVISAARERGLRVPDDLAVIGFDDIEIAEFIGLTTVGQPLKEAGRQAVALLLQQLGESPQAVQQLEMPLTLKVRTTA
ncbi:MAG: LacI family DNA-binding transcriptional regulator [Chloroflexi bacterium OHK40]